MFAIYLVGPPNDHVAVFYHRQRHDLHLFLLLLWSSKMLTTKPPLVVITGDPVPPVAEQRGNYANLIATTLGDAYRGTLEAVDPRVAQLPANCIDRYSCIVISGSAASVTDDEPWMVETGAWLRQQMPTEIPILGICFGHQLLARALGGSVTRNPKGREIGTVEVTVEHQSPLTVSLPSRFRANAIHRDTVATLPETARVLARNDMDDHQVVQFGPRCFGVQFHPELSEGTVLRQFFEARRELLEAEGVDVDARKASAADAPEGAQTLRNFVTHLVLG